MKSCYVVALAILLPMAARAAEIPYPAALDAAAVNESAINDFRREGLFVGNGDLNGILWQRDGRLSLRISKNDVWDARIDTSHDAPLFKVDVKAGKWTGSVGDSPSWGLPYPAPRCAAIVNIIAAGNTSRKIPGGRLKQASRLDLGRAVATSGAVSVRALADRHVFLIQGADEISLEEIKSKVFPAAEIGETQGAHWLLMKMPGDVGYQGMQYAIAAVRKSEGGYAVALLTSRDTHGAPVLEAALKLAKETAAEAAAQLIVRHGAKWREFWSASGVRLDDPDFQKWWYRMAYYLRCATSPGAMAMPFMSTSSNDAPPWHGDIHHNYNAWQPYWTCMVLNHPELSDPRL